MIQNPKLHTQQLHRLSAQPPVWQQWGAWHTEPQDPSTGFCAAANCICMGEMSLSFPCGEETTPHLPAQAAISICFTGEKEQRILQSKGQLKQLECKGCGSCLTARPGGQCRRLPAPHKYCMSRGEGLLQPPSAPALPLPSPLCI